MTEKLWLGISDLEARGLGERSGIYLRYKRGEFPEPKYIAERRVWALVDIQRWEAEQLARPAESRKLARNLGRFKKKAEPAPPTPNLCTQVGGGQEEQMLAFLDRC